MKRHTLGLLCALALAGCSGGANAPASPTASPTPVASRTAAVASPAPQTDVAAQQKAPAARVVQSDFTSPPGLHRHHRTALAGRSHSSDESSALVPKDATIGPAPQRQSVPALHPQGNQLLYCLSATDSEGWQPVAGTHSAPHKSFRLDFEAGDSPLVVVVVPQSQPPQVLKVEARGSSVVPITGGGLHRLRVAFLHPDSPEARHVDEVLQAHPDDLKQASSPLAASLDEWSGANNTALRGGKPIEAVGAGVSTAAQPPALSKPAMHAATDRLEEGSPPGAGGGNLAKVAEYEWRGHAQQATYSPKTHAVVIYAIRS